MSSLLRTIRRRMLRASGALSRDKTKARQSKRSAADAEDLLDEIEHDLLKKLKEDIVLGEEQKYHDDIELVLQDIHDIIEDAAVIYKRDTQLELEILKQLRDGIVAIVKLHKEFEQMKYPDNVITEEIKDLKRLAYEFFERTHSEMRTAYAAAHGTESIARFMSLRSNYAHRIFVLSRRIKRKINTEKRSYEDVVSSEKKVIDSVEHKQFKEYKELEGKLHSQVDKFQKLSLKVFKQIDESMRYDILLLVSLKHDLQNFSELQKDAESKGYALKLDDIHRHFTEDTKMYNEELKEALNMARMLDQTANDVQKAA